MNFAFIKPRKPEPVEAITVHLWHRKPDQTKVMRLRDSMLATKGMRHARLQIHDDAEQSPGTIVVDGLDCTGFDLKLFRQMVSDIF